VEWVGFGYAVLVFDGAITFWGVHLLVELGVGFCSGFCCL